jgi:hypothetical protein
MPETRADPAVNGRDWPAYASPSLAAITESAPGSTRGHDVLKGVRRWVARRLVVSHHLRRELA